MSHFARSLRVITAAASVVPLAVAALVFLAPGAVTAASFDSLPPGEQKIVRALYAAQSGTSLTLDQIAERKGGRQGGWGQVFKEMKAQGYVTQKNLGAVVSDYEHRNSPSSAARADKAGREGGGGKGAASRSRDDRDRGSASPSSAGGMGHGGGAGRGGGRGR